MRVPEGQINKTSGMPDEFDIRDVIRSERDRLRPTASQAKREHAKRLRQITNLLQRGTEEELVTAMRRAGLCDGSPEFENALTIWRENRS
jgi:hypothetical protein